MLSWIKVENKHEKAIKIIKYLFATITKNMNTCFMQIKIRAACINKTIGRIFNKEFYILETFVSNPYKCEQITYIFEYLILVCF